MATKVIGLDFGSRSVKLCESSATLRTTELVGFDFELLDLGPDQRPSMEMLADAAHSLLNRRGLLSETILCTPPSFMVSFVELEFPFASTKKIDAVLAFELDDRIPLDVEEISSTSSGIRSSSSNASTASIFLVDAKGNSSSTKETINDGGVHSIVSDKSPRLLRSECAASASISIEGR